LIQLFIFVGVLKTHLFTEDVKSDVKYLNQEKPTILQIKARLKQFAWQLRYAHVFWLIAQDKFKHQTFKTKQERVRFYATAYNYGFLRPETEIDARINKAQFPFDSKYVGEQVPYGDLAVEFFENYAKNF
jgi:hypothetical protein